MLNRGTLLALLSASLLSTACSSNLTRFDVINAMKKNKSSGMQVTRYEIADQGSGEGVSVIGPGGHYVNKITTGGSYLRRNVRDVGAGVYEAGGSAAAGGHSVSAGLHGNMRATR